MRTKLLLGFVVSVWAVLYLAPMAIAFDSPQQGSFAYDVYEIAVKKILEGPIGFVGGVAGMVIGASRLFTGQWMGGILPILGGALILKSESILNTLNMTI